jgi:outer membrane protein assembly factor BamB/predicted phosphodiesterase
MIPPVRIAALIVLAATATAHADTVHVQGTVYLDRDRDHHHGILEPGVPGVVVSFAGKVYTTTGDRGHFSMDIPAGEAGMFWARVPEGYEPGPVWVAYNGGQDNVDLGLRKLAHEVTGPLTFVVAADTHIHTKQDYWGARDLAIAAAEATALDPSPAFFTILGDITQGNADAEFDLVDGAIGGMGIPYVPVPGNHDWYDGGATWFRRYGPDNYSFDIGGVHFVVWNMSMSEDDIRAYLGSELALVDKSMPIVAMTHAPPPVDIVPTLRSLGVDYVLTGHTHTNRIIDHDGFLELNTEPMLMGGLDFTPAGYRVVTIEGGKLTSYHRTTIDAPYLKVMSPVRNGCAAAGTPLVVAAALDAGDANVTARIDCATPIEMRFLGGWSWRTELPPLTPGVHEIDVDATTTSGASAHTVARFEVCDPEASPQAGGDWPQLGGNAQHSGARDTELAPPLVARWTQSLGGHALHAAPAIAAGTVFVTATDLGDGGSGGIVAYDLVTGALKWRHPTAMPARGAPAISGGTVIATTIDGSVIGLDAMTGAERWRFELDVGVAAEAGNVYPGPVADTGDVLVGNQRAMAAISVREGAAQWMVDPVPEGRDSQSLAEVAVGDGVAVGVFNRAIGGISAWDRMTGASLWRVDGAIATGINATPVIADHMVFIENGLDAVFALDLATGALRWKVQLDPQGFDWGNATIGTPAFANGTLVVPTLYRDVIALDAATGAEKWRHSADPSILRTTHYRGVGEAAYAASPVITGSIVWIAGTDGKLVALALDTGDLLWSTDVGAPVFAGAAVSGDWLVVTSFDGTVHAYAKAASERSVTDAPSCEPVAKAGCCDARGSATSSILLAVVVVACVARWPSRRGRRGSRRSAGESPAA